MLEDTNSLDGAQLIVSRIWDIAINTKILKMIKWGVGGGQVFKGHKVIEGAN